MFALRITDTIFNCNCVSTLSSVSSQLPSAIAHLSFVSSLAFSLLSTIIRRHRLYTLAYDTSTTSVTASFSAAVNNNIASRYFRFFIVRLFWFLLPLFHFLSSPYLLDCCSACFLLFICQVLPVKASVLREYGKLSRSQRV